nr:signal recognition particle 14 kDa protein [Ipomoea batatas]
MIVTEKQFEDASDKSKAKRNKLKSAGEKIEYKCLIRATDGKKNISTMVGPKDHQRFQASYAILLKAQMTALKKRERKDRRKAADSDKKQDGSKKPQRSAAPKASS